MLDTLEHTNYNSHTHNVITIAMTTKSSCLGIFEGYGLYRRLRPVLRNPPNPIEGFVSMMAITQSRVVYLVIYVRSVLVELRGTESLQTSVGRTPGLHLTTLSNTHCLAYIPAGHTPQC